MKQVENETGDRECSRGRRALTPKQCDAMCDLCWALDHFDGISTGRQLTLRVVRQLVDRGLAEYAGNFVKVDGDGWTVQPERYRACYRPTSEGVDLAEHIGLLAPETATKLREKLRGATAAGVPREVE